LRVALTCATIRFMEKKRKNNYAVYLLTANGAALTKARLRKRLAQEEVAQRVGIDKSTICRWEQGVIQTPQDKVFQLVELLGTDDFVRLNGKVVLTKEEIEAVRQLRGA
jgi:transcriptional regulator with XRE-family HTH domain